MSYQDYFYAFWQQYINEIPAANKIDTLLQKKGETMGCLEHDHLALRTFNDPRVEIEAIMQPFVSAGYKPKQCYDFPEKRLFALHYEPPKPDAPKIFISQLLLERFSPEFQSLVKSFLDKIPKSLLKNMDEFFLSKTVWGELDFNVYNLLLKESQFAAWLYAYGYRTNHFAVNVNKLKHFSSCAEINTWLKKEGFTINNMNGEVKGSPQVLLEQSSIMAENSEILFKNGIQSIPSCYYEFVQRFPDATGKLYSGFIADSADRIFQSTDAI